MDVAIVYESMFGNTRTVAEAIADGLHHSDPAGRVSLVPVAQATPESVAAVDLLIVGGPTHMLRMSSVKSRRMGVQMAEKAAKEGTAAASLEPAAGGPGVREWLDALPAKRGRPAAAFDTHLGYPMSGSAARSIARRLRRHGYRVAKPVGFVVKDTQGPLRERELDRAREWGAVLARQSAA